MDETEELEEALEEGYVPFGYPAGRRRERLQEKNKNTIAAFLGSGKRYTQVGVVPRYYAGLMAWALRCHLERSGCDVQRTLGYHQRQPVFEDIETGPGSKENLLVDGQMLARLGKVDLIITVDLHGRGHTICLEGTARHRKKIDAFILEALQVARSENFYRGQKLEYSGSLEFLAVKERAWESIIMDADTRREIRANTVEFLQKAPLWEKYGIPARRGVLLSGEPGTGKTIICRALMAEAHGMTCISASAYCLEAEGYISSLYEVAQELSPCLVFIEDIDLIGQERTEYGYSHGSALLALLGEMDGVEARQQLVTIATTNCLASLDKALSQRPSRFDRIVCLKRPALAERQQLVGRLCRRIPLAAHVQEYIARHAEGCTPAQLQEAVFGLAVEHGENVAAVGTDEVEGILSRLAGRHGHKLGFVVQKEEEINLFSRNGISHNEVGNGDRDKPAGA